MVEIPSGKVRETEVERKYSGSIGAWLPTFDGLGPVSPARDTELVAVYHDTPQLSLLMAGITLRRRTGGHDAGWHVKLAREGDARQEVRLPLGSTARIPPAIREEVSDVVGELPLLPIVRMRTHRSTVELLAADGRPRASIVADRVEAEVLRSDVDVRQRWTEFEVELATGEPETTFETIEPYLRAVGLDRTGTSSKLARVLGNVEPAPIPGPEDPAADAALATFAGHFGLLQALESAVGRDEPDAVHQARVSLRRMRSILQVYAKVFDGDLRGLREELRWAGVQMGGPRDAEVIRDELTRMLDGLDRQDVSGPVRERIVETLDRRHSREFAALRRTMAARRWDALHTDLIGFVTRATPSRKGRRRAGKQLRRLADDAVAKVQRRLERAADQPEHLEGWHEVRKAAKGARYAHEVLEEVGVRKARKPRKEWKKVTSAFGEVQDAVILEQQLAELESSARQEGEPTDTYRHLRDRLSASRERELSRARRRVEAVFAG